MGKAQSKRSVDITTEITPKDGKVIIEEGTGKMGKIEDVDQLKPQINEDPQNDDNITTDKEKNESDADAENEKDITTEKEQNNSNLEISDDTANKTIENGNEDTINESKTIENGENNKKPKKEKVKKKWSFRSISFSKKDKQKPSKKDEPVNGECEKVMEEPQQENTTAVLPVDVVLDECVPESPIEVALKTIEILPTEEQPCKANIEVQSTEKPVETPVVAVEVKTDSNIEIEKISELVVVDTSIPAEKVDEIKEEELTQNVEPVLNHEVTESNPAKDFTNKEIGVIDNVEHNPPPLPLIPPPSQVTVFAESAMALTEKNIVTSNPDIHIVSSQTVEVKENVTEIIAHIHETSSLSECQISSDVLNQSIESEEILLANSNPKVSIINDEVQIPAPVIENDFPEKIIKLSQEIEIKPCQIEETTLILTESIVDNSDKSIVVDDGPISEKIEAITSVEQISDTSVSSVLDDSLPPPPIEIMDQQEDINQLDVSLSSSIINNGKELIDYSLVVSNNFENDKILLVESTDITIVNDVLINESNDLESITNNVTELNNSKDLKIPSSPIIECAELNVNNVPDIIDQKLSEEFKQEQDKAENGLEKTEVNKLSVTETINVAEDYEKTKEIIIQNLVSPSTPASEIKIAE